jgi:hypothetical protein
MGQFCGGALNNPGARPVAREIPPPRRRENRPRTAGKNRSAE